MYRSIIVFPEKDKAELIKEEYYHPTGTQVLIRTAFSTVSPGTERANITGDPSVAGNKAPNVTFPRKSGYSSSGTVEEIGDEVTSVKPGDRVVVFWGNHTSMNLVDESRVVKINDDSVTFSEAALAFIATFPLAAIRKTQLEIGESCMVMGLGLLGQLAVRLAHAAGAVPVIAVDPVASRRSDASAGGADITLDPFDASFAKNVRGITHGGVNTAIEVTGQGEGLDETLDCMAKFGRVALLGCTRDKNFTIDYYRKIHYPGITLVGAHTAARPNFESSHGYFTHRDDIAAVLKLVSGKRLDFSAMLGNYYSPNDCPLVYDRLINDRNFPLAVQFDWSRI